MIFYWTKLKKINTEDFPNSSYFSSQLSPHLSLTVFVWRYTLQSFYWCALSVMTKHIYFNTSMCMLHSGRLCWCAGRFVAITVQWILTFSSGSKFFWPVLYNGKLYFEPNTNKQNIYLKIVLCNYILRTLLDKIGINVSWLETS